MTNTYTLTESKTFTLTNAQYVASKIAADLQILHNYYGKPDENKIPDFAAEAAVLVSKGYLESIEYGFKKNGEVIFSLRYIGRSDGTLEVDDRPGKISFRPELRDANFYSYLRKSSKFNNLSLSVREEIEKILPIPRTIAAEPMCANNGYWEITQSYSQNGQGVERKVFKQW